MKKITCCICCLLLLSLQVLSQNYHAVNGSSFAGSLAVTNNPASIVHTPHPWDINVLSAQFTSATNAVTVVNYSFLSNGAASQYMVNNGNYARYAQTNINLRLFNARFALNRQQAVAFGMNIRGYTAVKTGTYDYVDTIKRLRSFLVLNEKNPVLSANLKHSAWLEVFGTYSRTLIDNEAGRLYGGITLKVTRGLSGVFAGLKDVTVVKVPQLANPVYVLQSGTARYGYSSNFDGWKNTNTTRQNLKEFFRTSQGGASADIGIEYIVKSQAVKYFNNGEDDFYAYKWKIGVSLLDLGKNQYKYGTQSRWISSNEINVRDTSLQRKLRGIGNLRAFNDSIRSILPGVVQLFGKFSIATPARLVVSVDKPLNGNFYVNGTLSLNLSSLSVTEQLYVSELSLLTLTPRWETRRWGVYLPIQYNTWGQFLVGGAFKAGPLLIGVHNWANVLANDKAANGGGYLALVIRPSSLTKVFRDKRLDCP